jgi:hypothetical protein
MREGTDKYDDGVKGGYTYGEKLALVAQGNMDPHEIGLTTPEDAIKELVGDTEPPKPWLSDFLTFEAVVVPPSVRAKWARSEEKIIPIDEVGWLENWAKEHASEHAIQGRLCSGNCTANFGQKFADPILGFAEMLRNAATLLEERYEQVKAVNDHPVKTREEIEAEKAKLDGTPSTLE